MIILKIIPTLIQMESSKQQVLQQIESKYNFYKYQLEANSQIESIKLQQIKQKYFHCYEQYHQNYNQSEQDYLKFKRIKELSRNFIVSKFQSDQKFHQDIVKRLNLSFMKKDDKQFSLKKSKHRLKTEIYKFFSKMQYEFSLTLKKNINKYYQQHRNKKINKQRMYAIKNIQQHQRLIFALFALCLIFTFIQGIIAFVFFLSIIATLLFSLSMGYVCARCNFLSCFKQYRNEFFQKKFDQLAQVFLDYYAWEQINFQQFRIFLSNNQFKTMFKELADAISNYVQKMQQNFDSQVFEARFSKQIIQRQTDLNYLYVKASIDQNIQTKRQYTIKKRQLIEEYQNKNIVKDIKQERSIFFYPPVLLACLQDRICHIFSNKKINLDKFSLKNVLEINKYREKHENLDFLHTKLSNQIQYTQFQTFSQLNIYMVAKILRLLIPLILQFDIRIIIFGSMEKFKLNQ